jgi:hypothetical protein
MQMAYDRNAIFKKAMTAIEKHKLFFILDVVAFLPIRSSSLYEFFPLGSEEMDSIKEALESNKIEVKVSLRKKFYEGDRSAELLALYKLICTPEERQALSMTGEINVNLNASEAPAFDLTLLTDRERKLWYMLYDKACGKPITIDVTDDTPQIENE